MNYQTEPLTMWFDRRLVMRASPIHGIGTLSTTRATQTRLISRAVPILLNTLHHDMFTQTRKLLPIIMI
jgi:hypothetical protein